MVVQYEMQRHDLLCLCSTFSEMSPLVIQEARAARIPVLASNVYGNIEQIVHGKNGLIFKMNDVMSLRKQIATIINNPYILESISKNIQDPVLFATISKSHSEMYKSLF